MKFGLLFLLGALLPAVRLHAQVVAVAEMHNAPRSGSEAIPSRVAFYKLPDGNRVGSVATIEVPYMTRLPGGDTFLVASDNIPLWTAGGKKTVLSEFDPRLGKVVATYEDPRPLDAAIAPAQAFVPVMPLLLQCDGRLVWLHTTEVDANGAPGQSHIDGIDWKNRKLVTSVEVPGKNDGFQVQFHAIGDQCLVIREGFEKNKKSDALLVWDGGKSDPVPLPLRTDQSLIWSAVGKDELFAQVDHTPTILRIAVDTARHRLTVSDPATVPALGEGGRHVAQMVYLRDANILAVARSRDHDIDQVVLLDPVTLKLQKSVELSQPVCELQPQGNAIYGYSLDFSLIVEYDKDFKFRRESGFGWRVVRFTP